MDVFSNSIAERRFLVVDDEAFLARQIARTLRSAKGDVVLAHSLGEARAKLETENFDFLFLDINLPDGRGLDLLEELDLTRGVSTIMMTSDGQLALAVEAMRLGAVDFLTKPLDLEAVPLAVSRAVERQRAQRRASHRQEENDRDRGGLFFGLRLEQVRAQINRLITAEAKLSDRLPPVLIEGETGVGKTSVARWLHSQGSRGKLEMIEINCATLPESLAESELFGHEKGAFTDARESRPGLFEAADRSTLFLDEIASLPLSIQAKLLTALEDGAIRRVGGSRMIPVNVRVICASLQDLGQLVAEGRFREDLRQRLDLFRLKVPPLRACREDLPELARHLLQGLTQRYGLPEAMLSRRGRERLLRYDWPGNVRELSHELERALILEDPAGLELSSLGAVVGDGLDESPLTGGDWLNPAWELPESGFSIEQATQRLIRIALDASNENISAAARRLGVPRDFIRYRIRKIRGDGE